MKLPTSSKVNISLVAVAAVLGVSLLTLTPSKPTVNLHNTGSTAADTPVIDPVATDPAPVDTTPTVTVDTPSAQATVTPTAAAPQSVAAPAPVTLVSTDQSESVNANDDTITDITCHYTMSDGTSLDKLAGSAPTDQLRSHRIAFGCPPAQ